MQNNQDMTSTTSENNQKNAYYHPIAAALISAVMFTTIGYSLGMQVSKSQERFNQTDTQERSISPTNSTEAEIVQDSQDETNTEIAWQTHNIDSIGLTFSVPPEMEVTSSVENNSQTGKPEVMTLYIQKSTVGAEYYQLYGIYQWNSTTDTQALLKGLREELKPESITEITISGLPALEGQIKGQRNRFVTYIAVEQRIFSLFTAEPTQENKQLTDQILATFQFKN